MVKIIENNSLIEEEVKSHFWKYSYLFENNQKKPPGKLVSLMITQLSQGYGNYEGGLNLMNLKKKGTLEMMAILIIKYFITNNGKLLEFIREIQIIMNQ